MRRLVTAVLAAVALTALAVPAGAGPAPTDPAYTQRDLQNIADAYGRIHGPGGQLPTRRTSRRSSRPRPSAPSTSC